LERLKREVARNFAREFYTHLVTLAARPDCASFRSVLHSHCINLMFTTDFVELQHDRGFGDVKL